MTGPVPKRKAKSDGRDHQPHRAQASDEERGALPDVERKYGEGVFMYRWSGKGARRHGHQVRQCKHAGETGGTLGVSPPEYEADFLGRLSEYQVNHPRVYNSSESECHNLQSGGPEAWHSGFYVRSVCSHLRSRIRPPCCFFDTKTENRESIHGSISS